MKALKKNMLRWHVWCCCDEHETCELLLEEQRNRVKAGDQPVDRSFVLNSWQKHRGGEKDWWGGEKYRKDTLHIDSFVVSHHCNNIATIAHGIKKFNEKAHILTFFAHKNESKYKPSAHN